jgi:hypothetical protein
MELDVTIKGRVYAGSTLSSAEVTERIQLALAQELDSFEFYPHEVDATLEVRAAGIVVQETDESYDARQEQAAGAMSGGGL